MDIANRYRDTCQSSSSDNESEDSEKECNVWKRAPTKRACEEDDLNGTEIEESNNSPIQQVKPGKKRNTIWSEVLQDQLISEDFEDVLLKNKPRDFHDRGKESYDYTLKYSDPRNEKDSDSTMSDDDALKEEPYQQEQHYQPKIQHMQPNFKNIKKFVKLNSAELTAARRINKVLNEKKFYLIQRIVKTVGIEKAMSLLSMTEEIEENGGMMINTNKRRRTPGGVYIQLLKSDKSITKEMLDKIFEGEMSSVELKKYYAERKKKRKEAQQNKSFTCQAFNPMSNVCSEMQDPSENTAMEAESAIDLEYKQIGVDNAISVPIINKDNNSDLEEGEIED